MLIAVVVANCKNLHVTLWAIEAIIVAGGGGGERRSYGQSKSSYVVLLRLKLDQRFFRRSGTSSYI